MAKRYFRASALDCCGRGKHTRFQSFFATFWMRLMRIMLSLLMSLFTGITGVVAFDCPLGKQGAFAVSDWKTQAIEGHTRIEATLKNVSGGPIHSAFGRLFIPPEAESAGMIVIQQPVATGEEVTIVNVVTTVYGPGFDYEKAASSQIELVACLTNVESP